MKSEQIQDSQHNFNLDCESESCSVLSDSLWPHGLQSPWNSPDQNTGVGSLSLLQGIFPTPGWNLGLPHCRHILYQLSHNVFLSWISTGQGNMGKANIYHFSQASLVAQMVKNLPAVHETWVWALNWEDPLEKGMAAQSCNLAWRIPWSDHGLAKSWTAHRFNFR